MRTATRPLALLLALSACLGWCCGTAEAGPPLICHELQVEEGAELLPWTRERGWRGRVPELGARQVVQRTLELLDEELPPFARMETLRRAALSLEDEREQAQRLLDALDERRRTRPDAALAAFDAGWLGATYEQAGWHFRRHGGRPSTRGLSARAELHRALGLSEGDPRLELALALASVGSDRREAGLRFARARAAVARGEGGETLARNLRRLESSHFAELLAAPAGTDM